MTDENTEPTKIAIGVAAETTITITRSTTELTRPQALVLVAEHPLHVGDTASTSLALWSDTSPPTTTVLTSDAGALHIANAWRVDGLLCSHEGAWRIEVDDDGDDLGLRCIDGFDDGPPLEVRLSFDRAWTQP